MARSKSKRPSTDAPREVRWARTVRDYWKIFRPEPARPFDAEKYLRMLGLQPDDPLFSKLANLAQVSAAGIEELKRGVLVELYLHRKMPSGSWVAVSSNRRTSSRKRALVQLRESAKLSRDLSAIVANLDEQASFALDEVDYRRRWGPPPVSDVVKLPKSTPYWPPPDFISQITEFAELSSEALTFMQTSRRPQGRPRRGAFSQIHSGSLAEFTLKLLLDVRAAGGRLTLDKNGRTGTLVEALALLRPHVRPGLIPNELPMSTLARVKALDQKIATALRSTEVIQS
jgi:hypothetical protein